MIGTALAVIAFILLGCGCAWTAVITSRSGPFRIPHGRPDRRWSRTEFAVCVSTMGVLGLGLVYVGIEAIILVLPSNTLVVIPALVITLGGFGFLGWVAFNLLQPKQFREGR